MSRINHFIKIFPVIVIMTMIGLSIGYAQDTPRPANLGVPVLTDGDTVTDELAGTVTARLYGFNASAGDRVTISMTPTDDILDPFLLVFGSRGEIITQDDDSGEVDTAALIDGFELPVTGAYFVLVTDFNYVPVEESDEELEAGMYELSISGITQPAGADALLFFKDDLAPGEVLTGTIDDVEQIFYFVLTGDDGQSVDLTLDSEDFDPILQVFGVNGDRVVVNDDDPDEDTLGSAIRDLELSSDFDYLVFATDLDFNDENFSSGAFVIALN